MVRGVGNEEELPQTLGLGQRQSVCPMARTALVDVWSLEGKLSALRVFSVTKVPAESSFLIEKRLSSRFPIAAICAVGGKGERSASKSGFTVNPSARVHRGGGSFLLTCSVLSITTVSERVRAAAALPRCPRLLTAGGGAAQPARLPLGGCGREARWSERERHPERGPVLANERPGRGGSGDQWLAGGAEGAGLGRSEVAEARAGRLNRRSARGAASVSARSRETVRGGGVAGCVRGAL